MKTTTSPSTLKERAARGILWGGLSNAAQQLLNVLFGIVLGRLLSPAEYGMVGMLLIFSLIATAIQEGGFTAALVNRPTIEDRDYNAVFWFSTPVALLLYGLLFFAAPYIADFYDTPELCSLARYSFLTFVVSSCCIAPSARLFKQLRVRERMLSNLAALLISGGLGILLAYKGFSYWGIVTQNLIYVSVNALAYWYFVDWRPSLSFDYTPIRQMLRFSSRLFLTTIFLHLNNNLFAMALGRFYSQVEVGNYTQANKWNFMGSSLVSGVVQGVAQPLFVETASERQRQARVFRKMLRLTCFLSFPLMLGLATIAHEFIVLALGEKWAGAAQMLRLLCVGGAVLPIVTLYTQYLLSRGRSATYMWGVVGLSVLQVLLLMVTKNGSMQLMLLVYVAINVVSLFMWHYFLRQELPIGYQEALTDVLPFALLTVGVMLGTSFCLAFVALPLWATMLAKILLAAVLYLGTLHVLKAQILQDGLQYLFRKKAQSHKN